MPSAGLFAVAEGFARQRRYSLAFMRVYTCLSYAVVCRAVSFMIVAQSLHVAEVTMGAEYTLASCWTSSTLLFTCCYVYKAT